MSCNGTPHTHWPRLRRHDHLAHLLTKAARVKGWLIEGEKRLRDATGRQRKPDLTIVKDDRIVVVDVVFHWKDQKPFCQ